jgi:hypothetical protein
MRVTVTDQRLIVARVAEVIAHHDINIDSSGADHHRRARFLAYDSAVVDVINAFEFMVGPVLLLRVGSDFYRLQRTCLPAAETSTTYENNRDRM